MEKWSGPAFCEFALGVKYMWAESEKSEYAISNGCVIFKDVIDGEEVFSYPFGGDVELAISEIESYVKERGMDLIFSWLSESNLEDIKSRYPLVDIERNRDTADYIYHATDLINFSGKKYHGQRNHVNKFKMTVPNFEFKEIEVCDLPRISKFLDEQEADAERGEQERNEYECCRRLFSAYEDLSLCGGYIEIDGEIAAISVGEIVGDTLIVHIEKARNKYPGIYPTIVQLFAACFASNVAYINREDDAGDLGLRTSKMQYEPCGLLWKGQARCYFSREINWRKVETERLVIDSFDSVDMENYRKLATDDDRNSMWGYDYKADLNGQEATADYFAKVLKEDEAQGLCYSRKISLKNGAFVGEVVLYSFRADGSGEVGLRIVEEMAGNGYGREAYAAICNYLRSELGLKLHARCYCENTKSRRMITAAGFTLSRETNKMCYFD